MPSPLILALDTTTRAGSLALARDGEVLAWQSGDATRTHGERLPGEFGQLLDRGGVTMDDIDVYAVVNGPGSFTGLRVGIAAVQGLALARGRRVVAVPALEAFAHAARAGDALIGVWMDAQRHQVFAALYRSAGALVTPAVAPAALPPEQAIERWRASGETPDVLIGDGIDRYAGIAARAWPASRLLQPAPPLAPVAAVLACGRVAEAVPPHAIVPIYVRASDAELARDRSGSPPR